MVPRIGLRYPRSKFLGPPQRRREMPRLELVFRFFHILLRHRSAGVRPPEGVRKSFRSTRAASLASVRRFSPGSAACPTSCWLHDAISPRPALGLICRPATLPLLASRAVLLSAAVPENYSFVGTASARAGTRSSTASLRCPQSLSLRHRPASSPGALRPPSVHTSGKNAPRIAATAPPDKIHRRFPPDPSTSRPAGRPPGTGLMGRSGVSGEGFINRRVFVCFCYLCFGSTHRVVILCTGESLVK
jgi:hypothetical protein